MKKTILNIVMLIILLIPAYSDVLVSPYLGLGIGTNDNIDLVPTGAASALSLMTSGGLGISGYINPDLQAMFNVFLKSSNYLKTDYGTTKETGASLGAFYDLTERINLGLSAEYFNYEDNIVKENNYKMSSLIPYIKYNFTPYTSLKYFQRANNLEYINTTENINEKVEGINLSQQVTDWLVLSLGGSNFTDTYETTSYNYTAKENHAQLAFYLPENTEIDLEYGNQIYTYADWNSGRKDIRNILALGLTKEFGNDLEFSLYVTKTKNDADDDNYDYENTTGLISLTWYPELGSLYTEDSDSDFYYNVGVAAIDEENWGYAEKQFRKALFNDEENIDAQFYLAYVLHKQNKYYEAIYEFEKIIELDPLSVESYSLLLYDYQKTNQESKINKLKERIKLLATEDDMFSELERKINK